MIAQRFWVGAFLQSYLTSLCSRWVENNFWIDKTFHGDLTATSKGQMLAAQTTVEGSAGYVALECVTGTLHDRTGTFALQHSGTMNRGTPHLSITVIPDSATGELVGLAGHMTIDIVDGNQSQLSI